MSTYPRMTRANLRSLVRELTGVLSTDVITDVRIEEWLNEALYDINAVGDNLGVRWGYTVSPFNPIKVYSNGDTVTGYRFPGWEWDNDVQFPTEVKTNLYMESDSDTPPWNDGHYDSILAYKVASRILLQIVDDTPRATVYEAKYKEMSTLLLRDKFLSHNSRFITEYVTGDEARRYLSLYMKTLVFLGELVTMDAALELSQNVRWAVTNEYWELGQKYKWPFSVTQYEDIANFAPYIDIVAYGAAARIAGEREMPELVIKTLQENYNTRLNALKSKYLTPLYSNVLPTDLTTITAQVRGMVNEYSRDLSDSVIFSLIDDAYLSLCYERNWSFLDRYTLSLVLPNINRYPLVGDNIGYNNIKRVKNVIKTPDASLNYELNWFGSSKSADKLDRVPHILDGENNNSKYRFDLKELQTQFYYNAGEGLELFDANITNILITPTPDEAFFIKVRYTQEPIPLVQSGSILFDDQFVRYLVYATVLNVMAFTGAGDKKLIQYYASKTEEIKSQMYRYYELDAGSDSFQLGETGLTLPKYIPHFRVG